MANSALVLWLKWHVDLLPIDLLAHHATCPTNVEVAVVIEAAVAEAQEEIVVVEVAVIVAAVVGVGGGVRGGFRRDRGGDQGGRGGSAPQDVRVFRDPNSPFAP